MKRFFYTQFILILVISITLVACFEDNVNDPDDENNDDNYETVTIGNQVWMAQNLDVTHYRNGDEILHAATLEEWKEAGYNKEGAWCYYHNDSEQGKIFGKLYNWYAVNDERGLAPAGWKVPSDDDWKTLEMELGMSKEEADKWGYRGTYEGCMLAGKEELWPDGPLKWHSDFGKSGFNAIPYSTRHNEGRWMPTPAPEIAQYGYWWTATESSREIRNAMNRFLLYNDNGIRRGHNNKGMGHSVRCIKE